MRQEYLDELPDNAGEGELVTAWRALDCQCPDGVDVVLLVSDTRRWLRISNRQLAHILPEQYSLERFVGTLFAFFKDKPNNCVTWTQEARDRHALLSVCETIDTCFRQGDPDGAAAHGIAPLKLGVYAGLLALLDFGCDAERQAARKS